MYLRMSEIDIGLRLGKWVQIDWQIKCIARALVKLFSVLEFMG